MTKNKVNFFSVYFAISLALSQWYYAANLYGAPFTIVPKVFTSLFFVSLLAVIRQIMVRDILLDSPRLRLLLSVFSFYVFVSIASVAYTYHLSGWGPNVLEGLKLISGLIAGVCLFSQFRNRNRSIITFFLLIFTISVLFGIAQIFIQPDFFTEEGFFTYGATNRWWELSAIWGPYSFSGKNVFGLSVVYPIAILLPLLSTPYLSKIKSFFTRILVLLAFPVVFFSQSRASFVLLCILCINTYFMNKSFSKSRKSNLLAILVTITGLIYFILLVLPGWVTQAQNERSRFDAIRLAFNSEKSNWFFGTGFNSVYAVTAPLNSLVTKDIAGNEGSVVDVYFIRRWIETGIIGELSFLSVIAVLLLYSSSKIMIPSEFRNSNSWKRVASRNLAILIVISSSSGDFLSFQIVATLCAACLSAIIFGTD